MLNALWSFVFTLRSGAACCANLQACLSRCNPMPAKYLLHAAELALATVLAIALCLSWRADQRDRAQLASELAATKQLLTAADARQHDRDTQLQKTLAALATKKRTVVSPTQIVRDLPSVIPLPAPIALQTPPPTSSAPNAPKPSAPGAVIPAQ